MIEEKPYVVAEIGSSWLGDRQKLHELIRLCTNAGFDAVKLQHFHLEHIEGADLKHPHRLMACSVNELQVYNLNDIYPIDVFCSVFEPGCIGRFNRMELIKIRQKDTDGDKYRDDFYFTRSPWEEYFDDIIFSSKYGNRWAEINSIARNYPWNSHVMYCVPNYPTTPEEIDFDKMEKMDGFSCHCVDEEIWPKVADTDPKIVEVHVDTRFPVWGMDVGVSYPFEQDKRRSEHVLFTAEDVVKELKG